MTYSVVNYLSTINDILATDKIGNDTYELALEIINCISYLDHKGLLTVRELDILEMYMSGFRISDINRLFGYDRRSIANTIRGLSNRIAYILNSERLWDHITIIENTSDKHQEKSMVDFLNLYTVDFRTLSMFFGKGG